MADIEPIFAGITAGMFSAGSRPGNISPALQEALMKEAVGVASLADPAGRIHAVSDFYAQPDFELDQIAAIRLNAVRELRAAGCPTTAWLKRPG